MKVLPIALGLNKIIIPYWDALHARILRCTSEGIAARDWNVKVEQTVSVKSEIDGTIDSRMREARELLDLPLHHATAVRKMKVQAGKTRRKLAVLHTHIRRPKRSSQRWREERNNIQTEIRQMRSAGKVGRKLGKFSVRGGMSLALRRTAQNSPCASMGLVICTDCSGQTVSNWELELDAALRSSSKWHLSEFEAAIDALGGCSVSLIRSDCSNAKLWYIVSAHVAEYQSLYLVDPGVQGGEPDEFESRFIGYVQVADDKTGLGVRRMLVHQSRSIGYPTWIDYLAKRGLAPRTLIDGRPLTELSDRLKEQFA